MRVEYYDFRFNPGMSEKSLVNCHGQFHKLHEQKTISQSIDRISKGRFIHSYIHVPNKR